MLPVEFIAEKRDGGVHADESIRRWIHDYASDKLPDYQMAAWAMAVYLRGMTRRETRVLTESMLHSGEVLKWPSGASQRLDGPVVDKHSTGGIGDKVSLVLAPLLACCGLRVPMISGRGLGPTGGTLDKLESIPGFETELSTERLQRIVNDVGCVIAGASPTIAPADKKLYALRDVTGTVANIPLITASIMSKKLSEGLDALVLDVKWGSGAFMKSLAQAEELAQSLVDTGLSMGVPTTALLTDMNQPLGRAIGNALEVEESIACMQGGGPDDLRQATLELGADLLITSGAHPPGDRAAAVNRLAALLDAGNALETFERMVRAQGGDLAATRELAEARPVHIEEAGIVSAIDVERIGYAIIDLGGGRRVKTDAIDFSVGIEMQARVGDQVEAGRPIATIYARARADHERAAAALRHAIVLSQEAPPSLPLIQHRIGPLEAHGNQES